jgi:hypothetical protein
MLMWVDVDVDVVKERTEECSAVYMFLAEVDPRQIVDQATQSTHTTLLNGSYRKHCHQVWVRYPLTRTVETLKAIHGRKGSFPPA